MLNLGPGYWDADVRADYGSVDEPVVTVGYISGQRTIDHLRAHDITRVAWRLRIHELQV